jgi:uncharacterized membrane protein YfcA
MMSLQITLPLVVVVAFFAGAVASVTGFGIGSILTPLLALEMGTKVSVAVVSIPHFFGTALRFWMLRNHVNRRVFLSFGLMSAVGGLAGALLHAIAGGALLAAVLGVLLVFAGATGLTGLADRWRLTGWKAWTAGALSGLLGGLVGNQGGIRTAAMLGFDVSKESFVATATAIALLVDAARLPVYIASHSRELLSAWPLVIAATIGVVAGTMLGARLLRRIAEATFRRVVSSILLLLGLVMLFNAAR